MLLRDKSLTLPHHKDSGPKVQHKEKEKNSLKAIPRDKIKSHTAGMSREFYLRGVVPASIFIIAGTGGSGKGFFCLNMLDNKSNIMNYDKYEVIKPRKIAFMNFEDDILTISNRLGVDTFHDWSFIDCIGQSIFTEVVEDRVHKRKLNTEMFSQLVDYDILLIDTWAMASGIDENDNSTTSKAMRVLKAFAHKNAISIGLIHHTSKAGMNMENEVSTSQIRGASSLTDNARMVVMISAVEPAEKGGDIIFTKATITKANYTQGGIKQLYKRGERGELTIYEEVF